MERDGILFIDKSKGYTSHDVVAKVRKILKLKKIGHTGTLDPHALGLMVLCLGRAVRLQQFLTGLNKSYTGEIKFGYSTDTYDIEGKPISEPVEVKDLNLDRLNELAKKFTGKIVQTPPPFSAKKYLGKKFYELARAGLPVPQISKNVEVMKFNFSSLEGDIAKFEIECSSGTYIRSIAHEIGKLLGCGSFLYSLTRTRIGSFTLEKAIKIEDFELLPEEKKLAEPHFVPINDLTLNIPSLVLDNLQIRKIIKGNEVYHYDPDFPRSERGGFVQIYTKDQIFLGIGEMERKESGTILIKPKIILRDKI
ncbi:MAG: tRNA pseudouridine(55) synthase TruB [Thermoanaerobaculia bacterium]